MLRRGFERFNGEGGEGALGEFIRGGPKKPFIKQRLTCLGAVNRGTKIENRKETGKKKRKKDRGVGRC